MPSLRIPTPLGAYTGGQREICLHGQSVGEALENLAKQYPALKSHLFNEQDELRPFINLFLGEDHINDLWGLGTPLQEDDCLLLVPSIAGG